MAALRAGQLRTALLAALVAGAWAVGACSPSRTLESIRVLRDIEAGDRPSTLKQTTPAPTRRPITYVADGQRREADLYLPGEPARAGVVLVPGLTPRGRDDERLVAFANTMARARFEVIVPDLPGMRRLQVDAEEAQPIADAARYLDERLGGRPLGVAAVSFAVGPAVLALSEPQAEGRPDFFLGIGGYYDLPALITYVTTGFWREGADAPWQYRPPKQYGKWVFVLTNARRVPDPLDQAALFEIASRKLDDPAADVSDLTATLGPDGEAVYALITAGDPEHVPALIEALPPAVQGQIEALDLKRQDLRRLDVEFVLIHDAADRIIPPAQTEALAAAVAPGRAHVHIVEGLDHAEVKGLGVGDALSLVDAIYTLLRLRDAPQPATG